MAKAPERRSKRVPPVPTYGLSHLGLLVADPERSARFYVELLGARVTWKSRGQWEVQSPGAHDVISFVRATVAQRTLIGKKAGITHFGFRLRSAKDIGLAVKALRSHGAKVTERGEFAPGHPFVFAKDPDGYEIELWYE